MYQTIKSQTLALITDITVSPKPAYSIDGQSVNWTDYLAQLQKTVEWCDKMTVQNEDPVEIISTGR